MEIRKARLIVNKSGGGAGSGGVTFRATLPTAWVRRMGLNEDNRNLILEFKEDVIMIKKDNIFLVVTEDGNIVYNIDESELMPTDQIVYESDIESLVDVELDENTHEELIEDYETELEFYLSNATREDYVNYYIDTHLDTVNLTDKAKVIIQDEVIERIKNRLNNRKEEKMKTMFNKDEIKIICSENGGYIEYDYNYFKENFEEWARDLDITLADADHLRDYVRECGYNVKEIIG